METKDINLANESEQEPLPLWEEYINRPKKSPWKKARELNDLKKAEIVTPEEIVKLSRGYTNPRDACLFILGYITAGRIAELVRYQKIRYGKKIVEFRKEGSSNILKKKVQDTKKKTLIGNRQESIKKEDLQETTIKGKPLLKINIRNLKNKQYGENRKIIPFPLDNPLAEEMFKVIQIYVGSLEDDEELFKFNERRAEQIIAKAGMHPHFLRKLRLTHLVRYYNFSDQKLKTFAGWTDSRPSKHYIKINWQDLLDSM